MKTEKNRNQLHLGFLDEWYISLENNKGIRAEIRRAKNFHDVHKYRDVHTLTTLFMEANKDIPWLDMYEDYFAVAIGVIVHVKTNIVTKGPVIKGAYEVGKVFGNTQAGKPLISETRFKKLYRIECPTDPSFYTLMIRFIKQANQVKQGIPVQALAATTLNWSYLWSKREFAQGYFLNKKEDE